MDTDATQPDVAADGTLAFQAYADGRFHIWTAQPDGSDVTQLTDGDFDEREPVWSPDGQTIAFSSDRAGSYDIFLCPNGTARGRRLLPMTYATLASKFTSPSFRPMISEARTPVSASRRTRALSRRFSKL